MDNEIATREAGAGNIICDEAEYGQAKSFDDAKSSAALTLAGMLTSK